MTILNNTQSQSELGALILRITLGVVLLAHGLLKVLVFTIPGTVGFFESIGFPGLLAYAVILVEVVGGIALILGVFTRITALISVPILLGATWVHLGNGWLFSSPNGGWEFPAVLVVLAVVVALQASQSCSLLSCFSKKES